ncbi:MAG: hypothetical protein SGILL_004299 [Bacillariaceae sp.]
MEVATAFTTSPPTNMYHVDTRQPSMWTTRQRWEKPVSRDNYIGANTRLWSTTEDKEQKTIPISKNPEQKAGDMPREEHRENHNIRPIFPSQDLVAYEVVETNEEYDVEVSSESLALTSDKDIKDDEVLKILSSELGVQHLLRNTDLKRLKDKVPDSSKLPLDVLLQRTLDTFEDVAVHLRRVPFEKGGQHLTTEEAETRRTVVVLGSGWAAHALMKVVDCRKIRLIVVSPSNHFVFTPMLASASVGTVEYRSMTEAVRSSNPLMEDYLEGKAVDVNVQDKTVTVKLNSLLDNVREGEPPQFDLKYDSLVVSVGCKVDGRGVPGVEKALRLKTLDDARQLRQAVGECFEYSSRPDVAGPEKTKERTDRATIVICGGGPTGVELAGEIHDLATDITRKDKGSYPNLAHNIRVVLVHGGSELVPQFEKRLRKEAVKSLEKKGIEVVLNTRVTEVMDGEVRLSQKVFDDGGNVQGREDSELRSGITVWCAGTSPVSFTEKILSQLPEEARNKDGRIKVDKWMRPPMPDNELNGSVFVLGDAAAFPEGSEDIAHSNTLPATAQVAGQQGAYLARLLNRGYALDSTPPALPAVTDEQKVSVFDDPLTRKWLELRDITDADGFVFLNLGLLAYLGGGEALTQVQVGDYPLFNYFGSIAFVLWRSVYLVKQVATRNRVLVTFDWIKSAIFGRDLTRF